RLTRVDRPDGTAITYGYDRFGRLETITDPSGTRTLSYHPTTGTLTSIAAPDGTTLTYGYDGALLTSIDRSGPLPGSLRRTYDKSFRLTSESVNGVAITYGYDRDGLLTRAGSLTLSRDTRNGRLTGTSLGVVADTVNYTALGELDQYRATVGGSSAFSTRYTRDALGRITELVETIAGTTRTFGYTYDASGRLSQVRRDGVLESTYTYDSNGNRLTHTGPSGTVAGTYDAQDRLLTYGTTSYTYTANGELRTKTDTATGQTTEYTYDTQGNLRTVLLPDGTRIDYLIDGANRRIGKKVNGVLVQGFLYDEDHITPVAELDGAGNVVARFVYASRGHVPDYMIKGGVTYRIVADHLGSVRLVVDAATGAVAQRIDYDAFGIILLDTNPGYQPFGFAGGMYDRDTGLVRFGYRDFDPAVGRWTMKDPIGFAGGDGNLHAYVGGDPQNWVDPYGFDGVDLNLIGTKTPKDVELRSYGKKVADPDYFTVLIHANEGTFFGPNRRPISVDKLAELIKGATKPDDTRPIKLLACSSNSKAKDLRIGNVATRLANLFYPGRKVLASSIKVTVFSDGTFTGDFSLVKANFPNRKLSVPIELP
ncbi:MAG TPA: RHS repeat-associated core domain-containing protein, partial [Isosphaeraceae bacterium]